MGGATSNSQQSSTASSTSRNALYTPTLEAINQSIAQLQQIYKQGQNQLQPFNTQALQATNDMMFWQGLRGVDPLTQQSASLSDAIKSLQAPGGVSQSILIPGWDQNVSSVDTRLPNVQQQMNELEQTGVPGLHANSQPNKYYNIVSGEDVAFNNTKTLSDMLTGINSNLSLLTNTDDPTKRQELYDQIMGGFDSFNTTANDMMKTYTAGAKDPITAAAVGTSAYNASGGINTDINSLNNAEISNFVYYDEKGVKHVMVSPEQAAADKAHGYNASGTTWDPTKFSDAPGGGSSDGSSSEDFLKQVQDINELKNQIQSQYSQAGYGAPTAEAVMKRLEATPGYTTQLQSGLGAVQNMAISKGLFGSGRATKEITKYGQDYAQNALTNQFNRSAAIAGITVPTVSQASTQTVAQAAPIMASTQLGGSYWSMSPWTNQSTSSSQGSSSSKEGMGGLGQILGTVAGGLF